MRTSRVRLDTIVRMGLDAARWRYAPLAVAIAALVIAAVYPGATIAALLATLAFLVILYAVSRKVEQPAGNDMPGQIIQEHRLLRECIERSPIPFAVYDQDDYLIASNDSYEKLYKKAFDKVRRRSDNTRIHYADLVRANSEDSVPAHELDQHVSDRCRAQRQADGTGMDRHYAGFGWLRVTKFRTPGGAVAGFAVDINGIKRREKALYAQIQRSRTLENRLRVLANTDPLTGLPNRRAFFERLEAEFVRANRYDDPLSVIMMDIDQFKEINDIYGHGMGDSVITRIATAAAAELRAQVDLIGRVGGEEFAVLLPVTPGEGACECAERIRTAISGLVMKVAGKSLRVTASFGVASALAGDQSHSECMIRADNALYQAKDEGRNRVVAWRDGSG